jgi:hypothetical protein
MYVKCNVEGRSRHLCCSGKAISIAYSECVSVALGTRHAKRNTFPHYLINIIQRFQNKVLRAIVDAPWYVRNADLHRDLKMEMVTAEIKRFARKHEERLHHHDNVEAIQLLDNSKLLRRLNRTEPFEFAN